MTRICSHLKKKFELITRKLHESNLFLSPLEFDLSRLDCIIRFLSYVPNESENRLENNIYGKVHRMINVLFVLADGFNMATIYYAILLRSACRIGNFSTYFLRK